LVVAAGATVLSAQQKKTASSYGPINQNVTFEQIKAARMAVKAGRAQEHLHLIHRHHPEDGGRT